MYRKITITGTNIFFLVIMASFLVLNIVAGIAAQIILGSSYEQYSDKFIYITTIINEYILLLAPVVVLVLVQVKKANFKEFFRFNILKPVPALIILAAAVPAYFAALMLNSVVVYFLQFIGDIPAQSIPAPKNPLELLIGILIIGVTPAICEEMLHRGLMLRAYERRGTNRALVITALFFGFFHFDITNFFGTAFLGLLIGYYVIRTNSIFAGMLAHFLNNSLAEVIQYLWGDKSTPETVTMSSQELGSVILYGLAGLAALGLLVTLFRFVTKKTAITIPPIGRVRDDAASILSHWPVIVFLILYLFMALFYIATIVLLRFF